MELKPYTFRTLLGLAILVNALGLTSEILEPDGALYATISRYMVDSNDYLNIWADGHDWLDKPHLPFWLSAASMELFGVNAFAYKLPGFLVWLLGLRFTFLLGQSIYNKALAQVAVLVQALALHGVLALMDVRAEPFLTTFCVGGVYFLWQMQARGGWKPLLAAALCTAAALMTKGLFALVLIGGGQLMYWLVQRDWRQFLQPKWYAYLLLSLAFTTPELYALWVQFDSQPDKLVFGRTGVSGIRFFFWDSQFGRFFKTGPITNGGGSGDRSFFLHTTLWAFLPFSPFLFAIVGRLLLRKSALVGAKDWVVLGGCLLTFLLFSLSKFQLPHYVVILFPFYALITARYLNDLYTNGAVVWPVRVMQGLQMIVVVLIVLLTWYAQIPGGWLYAALALALVAVGWWKKRGKSLSHFLWQSSIFGLALYCFLNLSFYPWLMRWQAGMFMGKQLHVQGSNAPLGMMGEYSYSLEFYAPQNRVERLADTASAIAFLQRPGALLFTTKTIASTLQQAMPLQVVMQRPYFHVTMLTPQFLHPATRPKAETTMILVRKK